MMMEVAQRTGNAIAEARDADRSLGH
jgi:hypothetical protein